MPRRQKDEKALRAFGARVRALREAKGITQQRLSEAMKVRASTVSQIETGDLSPTLATMIALARALGVEVAELFKGDPPPTPSALSAEEQEALAALRELAPDRRALVFGLLRVLRE